MNRIKREPAVAIGIVAACIVAVLSTLAGEGVLGQDVVDTIGSAIDPGRNGWLLPILAGLVTRAFVSPAQ